MAKIKVAFSPLSIPAKIQKGRLYITNISTSSFFTNPNPQMVTIEAAIKLLEAAYQDGIDGGKTKNVITRQREKELVKLVTQLAAYVQNASDGDAELILSTGFEIIGARTPTGELSQPQGLKAITSAHAGQIILTCKRVIGAKSYFAEKSNDGNTGWLLCAADGKRTLTVDDLPSISNIWLRITAVGGSTGQSPCSVAIKALVG